MWLLEIIIFGETELKDFAEYAFDPSGSYWKVNDTGDLLDDGNVSQVKDINDNVIYSGSKGRQGTLQEWLGSANAFTALMQPAGYEWNGTEKKWTKNPGKITHSVIEQAYKDGKLTDDQYNLIQLAAGLVAAKDEKNKNLSLSEQVMSDIQKTNQINTQIRVDMVNRAWEWVRRKSKMVAIKFTKNKKSNATNNDKEIKIESIPGSELDRFTEIVRSTVGASYSHERNPTSTKMDCSGVFVYAMQKLGYKVDSHLTAARMASGKIPGIVLYESVDNGRQGEKGVLNFYKWDSDRVQHVNYGVGKKEEEENFQIIDASKGDTWQTIRNKNAQQIKKAKSDTVNQTWAPFSTRMMPDLQAYLDFSKFNTEVEIK